MEKSAGFLEWEANHCPRCKSYTEGCTCMAIKDVGDPQWTSGENGVPTRIINVLIEEEKPRLEITITFPEGTDQGLAQELYNHIIDGMNDKEERDAFSDCDNWTLLDKGTTESIK